MNHENVAPKEQRIQLLTGYLKRLQEGENIDSVRKDFVLQFQDVDASEIMEAEQEMLAAGTPIEEVQKLCDVHAALFHGKIERAGETASDDQARESASSVREERMRKMKELTGQPGHPLWLFTKENEALTLLLDQMKSELSKGSVGAGSWEKLREVAVHYAKKGDLIYPLLKVTYGISGPSDVMWTVDDEIRDEINTLTKMKQQDPAWKDRVEAVLFRVGEMIYKEDNILFPNCAFNFSEEEWICMYHDMKDYAVCFGVKNEVWEKAEGKKRIVPSAIAEDEVILPGGRMSVEQLSAMLNTIPLEITFVDESDRNCYFNEGPKDFKRPKMAIGREVYSCHPPKVEEKVRHIINEFKAGTINEVPIWMEKNGKCMLVKYMAVRDHNYKYLGTLELVQDMTFAKEHFQTT